MSKLFEELYEYSFNILNNTKVNNKLIFTFEELFNIFSHFLEKSNIKFDYLRKNAKNVEGTALTKINLSNFNVEKKIFIKKDKNEFLKMNLFIHELSHLILDHNDLEVKLNKLKNKNIIYYKDETKLTKKQKEFVVDAISEIFVYKISGKKINDYFDSFDDKNIVDNSKFYRWNYIINSKISKTQFNVCKNQIKNCLKILTINYDLFYYKK